MIVAVIDWTNILLALIAGLPAIIAAVYAGRVHRSIKTPSGKAIGRQVEDSLHTAIANNLHLRSVSAKVDAVVPPAAAGEEEQVPRLVEVNGEAEKLAAEQDEGKA